MYMNISCPQHSAFYTQRRFIFSHLLENSVAIYFAFAARLDFLFKFSIGGAIFRCVYNSVLMSTEASDRIWNNCVLMKFKFNFDMFIFFQWN